MENTMDWEQKTLISELNQGKEMAKQLMNHLRPSSSNETREYLVDKILSSYEKSLSMLNWAAEPKSTFSILESPCFFANSSPRSEGSNQDSKHKDVFKKRKTLPRWTEQVRVCSGTALEGPQNDGYNWRKYGQKDILGANFPRGYYRCTHRHGQGCLATKQVQRSDEDPTIFEVTYRGRHTCSQSSHLTVASASKKICEGIKDCKNNHHPEKEEEEGEKSYFKFGAGGLKVKTEDLDTREDDIFPSFSFPCTPIESENAENNMFCESMLENNFMDTFSASFISPASSEDNLFSWSPCQMNSYGLGLNVCTSESDLTDILSAPTSVSNSPIGNFDFPLDKVDLDPNFPFDNTEFF